MKSRVVSALAVLLIVSLDLVVPGCSGDPQMGKQRYLRSGLRYMKSGKYGKSIIQFSNALKLDPRFVEAYYQLAQAYLANNDWNDACVAFEQSVELDPNRLDARLSLADLYLAAQSYDKAEDQASIVIRQDVNNATAYEVLAASLILRDQNERAREILAELVTIRPDNPFAHMNLALVEVTLRRYAKAERELVTAVEKDPHFALAYINLANFYRIQQQVVRSDEILQGGIANNPGNTAIHLAWAEVLYAEGREDTAEAALRELRKGQRNSVQTSLAIGDFYFKWRKMEAALTEYLCGLRAEPTNADLQMRLVEWYLANGRIAEAETLNREALRERPEDSNAGIAYGRILLAQGKRDEAIAELRRQVSQAADSINGHYYLGNAYWQNEDFAHAKSEFKECLKITPDFPPAQRRLAELHLPLGEIPAAREYAESASYETLPAFFLTFDTSTYGISITGTVPKIGKQILSGTIKNFSTTKPGAETDREMTVAWNVLPAAVEAQLGTKPGVRTGLDVFLKNGKNNPVDVDLQLIRPTPDMGTGLVLGTGLLCVGTWLRRVRSRRKTIMNI